jgi:uncharacterized protein YuzE
MEGAIGGPRLMMIAYSPDADVLTIQLRDGKPVDSRHLTGGIIIHLGRRG